MKPYIRTVCGDFSKDQFKTVLIHEHIIWNIVQPNNNISHTTINLENRWQTNYETDLNKENSHQEDTNIAMKELKKLKSYGGDLIVDQSTYGIGRNPNALYEVSKNSGINIGIFNDQLNALKNILILTVLRSNLKIFRTKNNK